MSFTKLFSGIIHSTIWREPDHVRLLWVTMLAMADRDGLVEASVPGLADAARITLKQCEEGLVSLSGPDPYSRTKDHAGRRIEAVDGGWLLLNHAKYRAKMSQDEQREKTRLRVARHRERNAVTPDVTPGNECNDKQKQKQKQIRSRSEAEAEAEADPSSLEEEARRMESNRRRGTETAQSPSKYPHSQHCPLCRLSLRLINGRNGPFYAHGHSSLGCDFRCEADEYVAAVKQVCDRAPKPLQLGEPDS